MKQGKPVITTVMIGLAVALTIYFGFYIFDTLHAPFDTTVAYNFTLWDSVEEKGVIVRDEQVLPGKEGIVDVIQAEGERVAAGQTVALVYRDTQAQADQAVLEELQMEIKLLNYAMNRNDTTETSARLDEDILQSIVSLRGSSARHEFSALEDQVIKVKSGVLKRGSTYGDGASVTELSSRLQELKEQLSALSQRTAAATTLVKAERSGTYSAQVDGLETVLTPHAVKAMTPDELQQAIDTPQKAPGDAALEPVGKLISSARWYFATVLDSESARRLKQGQDVTVRFAGDFSQDVPMRVETINTDEDGSCAAVLSSDRFLSNTTMLREQSVEIIFHQYSGLRLPNNAVHQLTETVTDKETGEEKEVTRTGVYALIAGQTEFKEVDVLITTEDFCVVKPLGTGKELLQAGDEVVTRAKHLEDGLVLRH